MLNLKQGHNEVAVTLAERGATGENFYVILASKSTKEEFIVAATDNSQHKIRYNLLAFNITMEPGEYEYRITSQDSPQVEFESGLAVIAGQQMKPNTYSATPVITTWKG